MSYEAIVQETAALSRLDQLKLLVYLANLIKENEVSAEDKIEFGSSYHKGFFDLFGSLDDPSFKEPADIPIELDGEVSFE
jgi:hypothetical protein